ncbi:hypothetical protein PBPRA1928 [Photobacterium profundum SS9]|uniref:Uncharacterized protein n=1 Tax=Photobacterium profundum (strain SS9) TaxID=298386 RepID=Q6LQU4_PHOPR|nr:hypothetical protein PBPRA1928 [Photobacterium profundum SS9]
MGICSISLMNAGNPTSPVMTTILMARVAIAGLILVICCPPTTATNCLITIHTVYISRYYLNLFFTDELDQGTHHSCLTVIPHPIPYIQDLPDQINSILSGNNRGTASYRMTTLLTVAVTSQ